MVQLALKLLHELTGFTHITLINTQFNHDLITTNGQSQDLFAMPGLKLLGIPDGLPPDHGRLNDGRIQEFGEAIDALHKPLQSLIEDLVSEAACDLSEPPITCIISDSYFYWMADIADAVRLPWVALWTTPAHGSLAYCSISPLVAKGILPVNCMSSDSTQRLVDCIPGLHPLKACELPSFLQSADGSPTDFFFQWSLKRFSSGVPQRAKWHLANTTYKLDTEAVYAFQGCMGSKFWPVGPLLPPQFFSGQMHTVPAMGTSLWTEGMGCKEWLDKQEDRSVLYISVGSIVHLAAEQVEEVAAGVEASGHPFLWVLRVDVDAATLAKLEGFKEITRHRGLVLSWAPQLLVLSHQSVTAFLTHCGWNSVLEGISGGVPMLAWPGGFSEQQMNAKYMTDVWRVALSFERELTEEATLLVKRGEVERVIVKLLGGDGEALRKNSSTSKDCDS
ncbi:hypothetical protein GOP47_0001659 [Adiantum capillus-veneris]|uniref:Glycosyltransferase n=1 Tax=Adiantum capillus-veneris TaxID=13818 RepID=A0A9D4V8N7_ADICA|nr:hypothetical protein GOP47_0001659 [Adiantum capillus-veneris]